MKTQTIFEEITNSFSHFIGLSLSIAGLVILLLISKNNWETVSYSIYGSALILVYLTSTLYHAFPLGRLKKIFQTIDHSAIFILIAGTYTPFLLTNLRSALGWSLFGVIWGLALLGIILKIIFKEKYMIVSTIFYIVMGWMIIFAINPLRDNINNLSLIFLITGGLTYTLGVIFFGIQKKYFHNIWHLFVLGGSILHYFSILVL